MSMSEQGLEPGAPADEDDDSDATVIWRSLRQPEAFATIFDRHAAPIGRYLTRRVGRDTAQDLLAETFLAAFRGRRGYDRAQPVARLWLFGIATRILAGHWRTEQRRLRLLAVVPAETASPGPEERVAAAVTAWQLRGPLAEALAGLAAGDRDVLLLVAWADLSYAETATSLDIPIGTVRSRLNRARRTVRAALGEIPTLIEECL
jgi:RNA polymerase sigma-70 factor (ECF subfamily)